MTDTPRKGLVLTVLGACFLVVMMDNTILNVALRAVQEGLSASNAELQWAVDAYILVYAALMFTAGVLADSFGRRRMLLLGLAVFAVASALSAYADSPEELIAWRAVMGLGGAVVPPVTLAIIKQVFRPEEQGKAMGVWAALGGMSVAFGPILGGLLLERFWWGSVFLINVPVVLIMLVLIPWLVPESTAERRSRLDLSGVLLSVAATGALVYGVIRGGETGEWIRPDALGAILAGLLLGLALLLVERRRVDPALDLSLFRNPAFTAGTVSIALSFFALTGGTFLLVFYVQLIRGYGPLELGLVLLPVAVGSVVAAISSAGLSAGRGPRFAVVTGLLLLAAAMLGLFGADAGTALWLLELVLLVAGLGMGLVMGTTTPLAMAVVPAEKAAVGAAVNNTVRQIGAALGVAVLGSVYSVQYRAEIGSALDASHLPLPPQARESLGSTVIAVERLVREPSVTPDVVRAAGQLLDAARGAFVTAMHRSVLVAFAVLLVAAVLGLFWLPRHQPAGTPDERSDQQLEHQE